MAHQIHIAVLDTDIPCLSVYAQRGLYSSQFRVLLQSAAERINKSDIQLQNGPLSVYVTAFDVVGGSLPPLECLRAVPRSPDEISAGGPTSAIDAILITGSAAAAYDPYPWVKKLQSYIRTLHAQFPLVKIFGSCFGHQVIAQALLAENSDKTPRSTFHVERSVEGHEVGIHPITLNPAFTANFPPLASKRPFRIQLIHGDIVAPTPQAVTATVADETEIPLPVPWINIGSSAACSIQGLYNPGRILTYQGHFEFDTFVNRELCIEFAKRGNWPALKVTSYLEQIERSFVPGSEDDDDSKAAAEAVLLFFAGEDHKKVQVAIHNGMLTPPLEEV
ncbi:hypothetical protein N7495_001559 [Penicillium taxi]|uniref:uncharacterized protein n=1 Tax=Penicillium taxi TaxID=168475 RepID=UPI002544F6D3|nr:uncharacterized protein N7495_001559 [Penicillium taxi]KAJ5908877.1 hypothetical protein N7495_001559 [Penicillium taxi]